MQRAQNSLADINPMKVENKKLKFHQKNNKLIVKILISQSCKIFV